MNKADRKQKLVVFNLDTFHDSYGKQVNLLKQLFEKHYDEGYESFDGSSAGSMIVTETGEWEPNFTESEKVRKEITQFENEEFRQTYKAKSAKELVIDLIINNKWKLKDMVKICREARAEKAARQEALKDESNYWDSL